MNQELTKKVIRLCEDIMNSRKGHIGDHYVFTPQINADFINKLYSELTAPQPTVETDGVCPNCGYSQAKDNERIQKKRNFVHGTPPHPLECGCTKGPGCYNCFEVWE